MIPLQMLVAALLGWLDREQPCDRGSQTEAWTAGTIHDCQLMPKREDFKVQHRARTNQKPD